MILSTIMSAISRKICLVCISIIILSLQKSEYEDVGRYEKGAVTYYWSMHLSVYKFISIEIIKSKDKKIFALSFFVLSSISKQNSSLVSISALFRTDRR